MVKKAGCKNGVKVGSTCLRVGDYIYPTATIKNVTKIRWGDPRSADTWPELPHTQYNVQRLNKKSVILAFSDKSNRPPFISSKHIYRVPVSKLKGKIKKVK